MSLYLLQFLCL